MFALDEKLSAGVNGQWERAQSIDRVMLASHAKKTTKKRRTRRIITRQAGSSSNHMWHLHMLRCLFCE